jgi:hypothetical protein
MLLLIVFVCVYRKNPIVVEKVEKVENKTSVIYYSLIKRNGVGK